MANSKLRATLKNAQIPYWRIAEKLGVHENTILRKMRTELSDNDRKMFEKAVTAILAERGE